MNREMFSFLSKIDKEKREKAMIIFLLGIFFLLAATPVSGSKKAKKADKADSGEKKEETVKTSSNNAYIEALENRLEQTITGMEGAGKVLVMITLKDSGEKILDKNQPYESETSKEKEEGRESERTSIRSDQETVLIEQEGNQEPIVVLEKYPEIEGVVVVCEGGGNAALVLRIKEAVQVLFGIDAHKVVVCKLQK